ncbi:MAG: hypothetical protein AAGB48_10110 [Planctomycetota bacterium]
MTSARDRYWVGFEPASDALRAVALQRGAVVAATEIRLATTDGSLSIEDLERLAHAMQRQGVPPSAAWVACPPERHVVAAVLELPPRESGAPIEALAGSELARDRRTGDVAIAAIDLPRAPRAKGPAAEYLAVGGGHDAILDLVKRCESVGIRIEAVDTPVTALARLAGQGVRLIAEVLNQTYRLHVCVHGRPAFSHVVSVRPGIACAVQLPEEVDRCAAYLAARGGDIDIESIILAGPGARDSRTIEAIRNEFNTAVDRWEGGRWAAPDSRIADPAFAQAAALSLWPQTDTGRVAA